MIREIVSPSSRELRIELPLEYVKKKLEVLILPFSEMETSSAKQGPKEDKALLRLFENAPNVKIPGDVDIDALMNEVNDVVL